MKKPSQLVTPERLASIIEVFLTDVRKGSNMGAVVVTADTDLLDDIGVDSLEMTQLVYWLEDATGAQFDLDRLELRHFRCVRELARFVDECGI